MIRKLAQVLLPLLVLAGAFFVRGQLALLRPAATHETPTPQPTPVEVVLVTAAERPVTVQATGVVQASAQVDLAPQVGGRVVDLIAGFTPGARFSAGTTLARIDARDYELSITQIAAQVAQAKLDLELEEARGKQADREWQLAGQAGANALALREPHLAAARARLAAAEAQLAAAKLALERTRLVAPFDGVVVSETLEVGQLLAPGVAVAKLMGTDKYRVRATLQVHELNLIDVPGLNAEAGAPARVRQTLSDGAVLEVSGTVARAIGELDPETRTAAVLVEVRDPLGQAAGHLPILPGAYVDVWIQGRSLAGTFEVPRRALVDGDTIWLADAEDRLKMAKVHVEWSGPETILVDAGLAEGDRVIVTPLSLPVTGLPLEVREQTARSTP